MTIWSNILGIAKDGIYPAGPVGPIGPQGPVGAQGAAGAAGSDSVASELIVTMEQYGSFANGVADPVLDEAALAAAMTALKVRGGGTLKLYGNYAIASATGVRFIGDNYSNIRWEGVGHKSGFHSTINAAFNTVDATLVFFQGATTYGLKNLTFKNIYMAGLGSSDYRRMFMFSNTDTVNMTYIGIQDNAVEGIYFNGANNCRNAFVDRSTASNIGLGVQQLSAYNLNADTMSLTNSYAFNCGQGLEQQGSNFRIIGNHFEQCIFSALLLTSTWASWIDPFDGVTVHTSANGIVAGNLFVNMSVGVSTGDSAGHIDHGIPVPGGGGAISIVGNTFRKVSKIWAGGADLLCKIKIADNYAEDAFDSSNYAIDFQKGWLIAENNTFVLGPNSKWAGLVRFGDRDPVNTKGTVSGTKIFGLCWTTGAMILGPNVEEIDTEFLDVVSPGNETYRRWAGSNLIIDGPLLSWSATDAWLVPGGKGFIYSAFQPSFMRVHAALPTSGTFKPGDRLENADGPTPWWDAICSVGGTGGTITPGITCTTTVGTKNFTITALPSFITQNQYVTIAGVTGTKKLVTYDPSTGIGTFDSNASASVVSAAVAYSPPTWVTR